jgi:hypothetical protein
LVKNFILGYFNWLMSIIEHDENSDFID